MSLWAYAHIKEKNIDEVLLEKMLTDFFVRENYIVRQKDKNYMIYQGVSDNNKMSIFLVEEEKSPDNAYVSEIINDDFEYEQLIIFDINKKEATINIYKAIIGFCIYLRGKIKSDILVTSDAHDEICLLKQEEISWSQNLSFDYSVFFN